MAQDCRNNSKIISWRKGAKLKCFPFEFVFLIFNVKNVERQI